jgi:tape measure domain-containing protein
MAKLKDLKVTIGLSKSGLTKLNSDLRSTKANFRRNFGEIANMAKNAALAITGSLVAGIGLLIKKGAEMQTLRTGFVSIAGGANKAAAIVKELNEFTAKTPFQLEEVSSAARQLLAVGTKRSALQKELKMLGDIAASSGSSIQEIASIFAKVKAKGKVELENLNQLAERGIQIFPELRRVTGDANMEFGAGSVSVDQFTEALSNMTKEGGLAANAMENLSETVEGRLTTLMDNFGIELSKAAEKTGLTTKFGNLLEGATEALQGISGVAESDVSAALGVAEEAMDSFGSVTTENLDEVETKMANAQKALSELIAESQKAPSGTQVALTVAAQQFGLGAFLPSAQDMLDDTTAALTPLLEMQKLLSTAAGTLNQQVLSGTVAQPGPSTGATTGTGDTDGSAARKKRRDEEKKAFIERFNESARLREAEQGLAEATFQHITTAEGMIEAQQMLRDAYGEVGGAIEEISMDEEEALFDPDEIERIKEGTRLLEKAAFAAENIGKAFDITSQLTEAAFNNIKDKSQGFHLVIKQMLEDLLKKAIALAAAFAAMSIFMGPSAMKLSGIGGFKEFMLGGLGIPQMAEGGLFTGASLAMVGEGPGTSLSNPEVVAPLDKLQSMMGGGNVTVTGRLDGRDILISSERANIDRNRIRGF